MDQVETPTTPVDPPATNDIAATDTAVNEIPGNDPPILTPRLLQIVAFGLAVLVGAVVYRYMHPASTFAADGDVRWNAAVERSHQANQPALVLFTADWCPACRELHSEVLSRSDIQEEIDNHYTMITVDLSDRDHAAAARASKFGVSAIPTLIRFDAQGKEISRTHGLSPEKMLAWLRDGE